MLTYRNQKQHGRKKTKADRRAEALEKAKPVIAKICQRMQAKADCRCGERRQR